MSEDLWNEVDAYFGAALVPSDSALDAALSDSVAAGLPAISVSPTQGRLLQILASCIPARSILEIGTLGGYSTIWLARSLSGSGRVVTLERDPHHADVARANIDRAGVGDIVEIVVGDATETLPGIAERGDRFDLVFIDADKANIPAYFGWALKLTHAGSLVIVDNVVREGAVIDESSGDPNVQGVRHFVDMLSKTPGLTATAIQTVGSKGYDGLAIVRIDTER